MGQCMGSLWQEAIPSWINKKKSTGNSRPKEYINGADLQAEEILWGEEASRNQDNAKRVEKATHSIGIFSLGKGRLGKATKKKPYILHQNEDDEDEDSPQIELYDMVADPRFFKKSHSKTPTSRRGSNNPPDLRQVVGLRNTLTCCVMKKSHHYGKLENEEELFGKGGAAYIVLNPRNLNGHATIPAPPLIPRPSPGLSRSKWSVNSTNSIEGNEHYRAPSIDLEWENDDDLMAAAAINGLNNCKQVDPVNSKTCDPDTCSISTNLPCTTKGSRASSHLSIPGLDWDSQVDNEDLLSLNNPEADFETEQLISEIEMLTSRALQETHQWGYNASSPQKITSSATLEANNNPTTNTLHFSLAN